MSELLKATGTGYDFGMFEALPRDEQGLPNVPSRQSEKEITLLRAKRKQIADYKSKVFSTVLATIVVAFCAILIIGGNIKVKQADRILRRENQINERLRADAQNVQDQLDKQVTYEELRAFVERRGMIKPADSQKHYFDSNENDEIPAYVNRASE